MPQLSLYVSNDNLQVLKARAEELGMSMSGYANHLIEQDSQRDGWPKGFWELYGSLADDTLVSPQDPPPNDDEAFDLMFA